MSADTIVPDPSNPQSYNRYAYTLNNPLRYTDPSGHRVDSGGADSCKFNNCSSRPPILPEPPAWFDDLTNDAKSCLQLGVFCSSDEKFKHFGIPTTDEQIESLVYQRAEELCNAPDGSCTLNEVKLHLNVITFGLSGVVSGIGTGIGKLAAVFNTAVAATSKDPVRNLTIVAAFTAVSEVITDAGRPLPGGTRPFSAPRYAAPIGAVNIVLTAGSLPRLHEGYLVDATIDVAVDAAQAQAEFEAARAILSYDRLNTRSPWAPNYYPDANPDTGWQWILSSQN